MSFHYFTPQISEPFKDEVLKMGYAKLKTFYEDYHPTLLTDPDDLAMSEIGANSPFECVPTPALKGIAWTQEQGALYHKNSCISFLQVLGRASEEQWSKSKREVKAANFWYDRIALVLTPLSVAFHDTTAVDANVVDKTVNHKRRDKYWFVHGVLLFDVVYKGDANQINNAVEELKVKTHARQPLASSKIMKYMIALAFCGNLCKVIYINLKENKPMRTLCEIEAGQRFSIIKLLIFLAQLSRTAAIHLGNYLATLVKQKIVERPSPFTEELLPTTLEFQSDHVVKTFFIPTLRYNSIHRIYKVLIEEKPMYIAEYSDLEELDHIGEGKKMKVTVKPLGEIKMPTSTIELKLAIRCVLSAVVWLHRHGFVHCDLRWPNILYDKIKHIWFLIDFELVSQNDTKLCYRPTDAWANSMVRDGHANYTFLDDLYQVGELINRALSVGTKQWLASGEFAWWLTLRNDLKLRKFPSAQSVLDYLQ